MSQTGTVVSDEATATVCAVSVLLPATPPPPTVRSSFLDPPALDKSGKVDAGALRLSLPAPPKRLAKLVEAVER